jgi:uncharacterized protein (TIGR00369 family)
MTEQVQPGALSPPMQEGPWRGWSIWTGREPFEELVGPFYTRREMDGSYTTGFRPSERNLNSLGNLHGGAIATFADYSLFMIACEAIHGRPSVTVTLNIELMRGARAETLLTGRGEVLRTTNSLVFVRGIITSEDAPIMSFSGVIKLIRT